MKPASYLTALGVRDDEIVAYLEEVDRQLYPYLVKTTAKTPKVYPLHEGVALQIASGKRRLRAAFCVTTCELFSGSYKEALYFAAAIEHLQNSMLIHDEITRTDDEADLRQSIVRRFGMPQAINIGDIFICLSSLAIADAPYDTELKLKLLELLCDQGFITAEGLNLDINLRKNDYATTDDYFNCAKKKTGSFLAMAARGGAIIGGAQKDMIQLLNNYSTLAGVAYDVGEELFDIRPNMARPRGMKIRHGARTLLGIHAAANATAADRKKLRSILQKPRETITEHDIDWTIALYNKTDSVKYAEGIVRSITRNALRYLKRVPESDAKDKLVRISQYYSRKYDLALVTEL
ncbi:MAG TPA: polyprenyl synthetase family protein [Chitinophagaceae bacterium]